MEAYNFFGLLHKIARFLQFLADICFQINSRGAMIIRILRVTLENVSKLLGKKKNVTDVSIFSDGTSIYVLTENDQMIDLLKKGQAVFGISLGPVHTETEAEIFSLFPEKISVQNR